MTNNFKMGFETILYEKEDRVAFITLNRPRVMNAVNVKMRDELWELLGGVREDPEVRVVILKGSGERAFCAGADISEFGMAPSRVIARKVRWLRDLWGRFLDLPQALIVAIHGYAVGAGIEMALCGDLRVASEDAQFGLPEVGLGMVPTAGGSQTLPRHMPLGRALELVLTGDRIGAAQALDLGLVQRVVPRSELYPTAEALAQKLLSRGPLALRYGKEAVTRGLDLDLGQGLALEGRLFARIRVTEEAREGVRAFYEGRAPRF